MSHPKWSLLCLLALAVLPARAAEQLKIGFISTLSGPSAALGIDIRDGFNLALKHTGGKLGGIATEVLIADDQMNPDTGKQLADRMLKKDKTQIITGMVFSNVLMAAINPILKSETFYVSPNATPSVLGGEQCNAYFFSASWPNDAQHEAMGKHVTDKSFKNVYLIAPNYPAGKDALAGFKRFYKGAVSGEVYTKLGQLDYAAELAQLRAAKPDAVYIFLPGGMGINFIKQYNQAGLSKDLSLFGPGFSADEDIIRAVGEPMVGMFNSSQWAHDLDNAQNKKFVADFQKDYGRMPTVFASQGYDTAMLIDAAMRDSKGKIEDKAAFRKALESANFKSVRGNFKLNKNHFPIQTYYLRQVVKDTSGRITNKTIGTIFSDHDDAYADQCKM
jgi:branched-chain amino acid transport system substrate-binding protein